MDQSTPHCDGHHKLVDFILLHCTLWHTASNRCGAKVRTRSDRSGHAEKLAKRGLEVWAVDISKSFVQIARRNAAAAGVTPRFELGDAAALPIGDSTVDFVACRAAFKNFSQPVKALAEMRRVLRPGGTALLIDMRRDVSIAALKHYVGELGLGWLNRWFMLLVFRTSLIKRAYSLDESPASSV